MITQRSKFVEWIVFLRNNKFLVILALFCCYFVWNSFLRSSNQSNSKEECSFAFKPEMFGEWTEEKQIEKSKIPIFYYFNGNSIPEWALLNIRNTLRFHEKVYFVSRDGLQVNFDGVINIREKLTLSKRIQELLDDVSDRETQLIHMSELKRTRMFEIIGDEKNMIYSDIDEIILKPIHECDFVNLVWDDKYRAEITSSLFCLNSTILEQIQAIQLKSYDPRCFACIGSNLFSEYFFDNLYWDVRVKKGYTNSKGDYNYLFKNPLMASNVDHIHIMNGRTIKNWNRWLTFTKHREWHPIMASVCAMEGFKTEW